MATPASRLAPHTRAIHAYFPMILLLLLAGLAIEEGVRLILVVDPAAQADLAGWYVLVLGIILAATAAYGERPSRTGDRPPGSPADDDGHEGGDAQSAGLAGPLHPYRDMAVCLLLVAGYAALLDPLGYAVAGIVVVFIFLRAISRYGWIKSLTYTVVMNAVLITLFELAGVVLPAGLLKF
ncbi:Tripartite tricarboxylate transporter TctB family [Prauserella sp. Am3]|nr:Tripartite tricarboxylate transporter TctB family [Prauserella sp. Am3]